MTTEKFEEKLNKNGTYLMNIQVGLDDNRFFIYVGKKAVYYCNDNEDYFYHKEVQEQIDNGNLGDDVGEWVKAGIEAGTHGKPYVLSIPELKCLKECRKVNE